MTARKPMERMVADQMYASPLLSYRPLVELAERLGTTRDQIAGALRWLEANRFVTRQKAGTRHLITLTADGRRWLRAGRRDAQMEHEQARWMRLAACHDTKVDMFFPAAGDDTSEAKAVCAGCGVREECLTYALDRNIKFGIWGGLSERERRFVRNRMDGIPVPHGTVSGYRHHGCTCSPCRDAANDDRARRRAGDNSNAEHGTRPRYDGGCRCEDCTEANTAYMRRYRRRRSA